MAKALSKLIQEDKTNSQINELVAKRFRIKMAINTIRNYGKRGGSMSELNPKQREAAQFKDGIAAVIAVPGSVERHAQ